MGGGGPHSAELSAQSRRQGASEVQSLETHHGDRSVTHRFLLYSYHFLRLSDWIATLGAIYEGTCIFDRNCTYLDGKDFVDFGSIDWGRLLRNHGISDSEKVLIFFDDHQSELKRLKQALKAGFRHLIFEDNYDTGTCDHYFLRHIYDPSYIRGIYMDLPNTLDICKQPKILSEKKVTTLDGFKKAVTAQLKGCEHTSAEIKRSAINGSHRLGMKWDITPPTGIRQAMEMQAEVERRICAQVLESEGKKQAQFDHLLYCSRAAEEPGAQGIANRRGAVQWLERRRLDCRQLRGSWIWSMRGDEAKRVCPGINLVQVPVARGKANLNLYRSAGAEVVAILASKGKCERASIDEVYLDLTDAAKEMLLQAPPDSPEGIFMEAAKSNILGLPADASEKEKNVRAWLCQSEADYQDKLLACGAIIVAQLRVRVLEETQFTCSAGIAHNKMLAKLVSGMYKPAQQTVVPSSSVQDLLASLPVKKMKQLGGKLGSSLQDDLGVETIGDLLSFTEEKLQEQYGVNTGAESCTLGFLLLKPFQGLEKVLDEHMVKVCNDQYSLTDKYTDGWLSSDCRTALFK
ncbi:DNA polymerase eta [Zea mays]|uniref:DNA polymerase eta n=1 Tax=Zea mays TaxID=4577 RepID=A0A1D6GTW8_MAIZE|nr:DNA polymerase eta [Zea mays]